MSDFAQRSPSSPASLNGPRFTTAVNDLKMISPERLKEQADNVVPRVGLAMSALKDAADKSDEIVKFIRDRPELKQSLASVASALLKLKANITVQALELKTAGKTSYDLYQAGNYTDAVLAAEPTFNARTKNTVQGILEDVPRFIE